MEEEGTEIIFRPGMGESVELDLLQYCTTEKNNKAHLKQEVQSTRNSAGDTPQYSLAEQEQRQESSANRAFFPTASRDQHSVVNRHDSLVESGTTDEDDESEFNDLDDSKREDINDAFHPALTAAVFNEGQEAVWHEDEYETTSSVYVQPEKKITFAPAEAPALSRPQQNSRNRMRVPFFKSRGKKAQKQQPMILQQEEPTPRPVKIHIKKKKVSKAVLLLPPKEVGFAMDKSTTIENNLDIQKERLIEENERYAAITENSVQARRLLDTALSGEGLDDEESKRVAKEAFSHAAAARRLASNNKGNGTEKAVVDVDNGNEEAIELENVLSYLAEEGEQAVLKHRLQNSMDEEEDEASDEDEEDEDVQEGGEYADAIDLTHIDSTPSGKTKKKKRRGRFLVSGYASRAVHYLESMLPKNTVHERGNEGDVFPDDGSKGPDFWSDAGISTLGLKTDTLEYGFSIDEGEKDQNDTLDRDGAGVLRNVDMMSLSSLNEILDGGGAPSENSSRVRKDEVLNEKERRRRNSIGETSPRAAVPEIGIPRKNQVVGRPPIQPRRNRSGILSRMTPKIMKSSKNEDKDKQRVVVDDNKNSNKKWGAFFKTPRAVDSVPSELNLVLEEPDEGDRAEDQNNVKSIYPASPSILDTPASIGGDKESNLGSTISNKTNASATKPLVEAESDSHLGIPKDNRYAPAFVVEETREKSRSTNRFRPILQDNGIELNLSVKSQEDQGWEIERGDENEDALSRGIVNKMSSSSPLEEKESKIDETAQVAINDTAIPNDTANVDRDNQVDTENVGHDNRIDTASADYDNREPVGMTPRRDGLEMEVNSNRKTPKEEKLAEEQPNLATQVEKGAELNAAGKDEKRKAEIVQNSAVEKGQSRDPVDKSKEHDSKKIIQAETAPKEAAMKKNPSIVSSKQAGDVIHADSGSKIACAAHEEMSTAESEGSKSKIFGRVVDIMGRNKRKVLVPNTIVEEKFYVDKVTKKISTGVHHINDKKKFPQKMLHETYMQTPLPGSKATVGQRAMAISKMKKKSASSSRTMVGDSTVVVQKAITHGNLKAVESNEEGDDVVPLNYLSVMLKKKLMEEKRKALINNVISNTSEPARLQRPPFHEKQPDADSFVAAIRGPRHKEAPGVALEEIAIRKNTTNRDPCIENGATKILIDLAPTPRRPTTEDHKNLFDDDDEEEEADLNRTRDPPIKAEEDERIRRKMITERLFQAGSSLEEEVVEKQERSSKDVIKIAPTVATAESFYEDPVEEQENVNPSTVAPPIEFDDANKAAIIAQEVVADHALRPLTKNERGGRRRISIAFLRNNKRK